MSFVAKRRRNCCLFSLEKMHPELFVEWSGVGYCLRQRSTICRPGQMVLKSETLSTVLKGSRVGIQVNNPSTQLGC